MNMSKAVENHTVLCRNISIVNISNRPDENKEGPGYSQYNGYHYF